MLTAAAFGIAQKCLWPLLIDLLYSLPSSPSAIECGALPPGHVSFQRAAGFVNDTFAECDIHYLRAQLEMIRAIENKHLDRLGKSWMATRKHLFRKTRHR
jgi:hypothetical protein